MKWRSDAQIAQLTNLLSLEKVSSGDMTNQIAQLRASLATVEAERDRALLAKLGLSSRRELAGLRQGLDGTSGNGDAGGPDRGPMA